MMYGVYGIHLSEMPYIIPEPASAGHIPLKIAAGVLCHSVQRYRNRTLPILIKIEKAKPEYYVAAGSSSGTFNSRKLTL